MTTDTSRAVDRRLGAGFKIGAALLTGLVIYALAGFLIMPRLIKNQIRDLPTASGQPLNVESVRFNPFSLKLNIHGVSQGAMDADPNLLIRRISADVAVRSIANRAWIVNDLLVDGPFISVIAEPDNPLETLADFLTRTFAGVAGSSRAQAAQLMLRGGHLQLISEGSAATNATVQVLEFDLEAGNLGADSTTEFSLTARLDGRSKITAAGRFSVASDTLESTLEIQSIDVARLADILAPHPAFSALAGHASLGGSVTYAQGKARFQGQLEADKITITQSAGAVPSFDAERILATEIVIANSSPELTIGQLLLVNPSLAVERHVGFSLDFAPWLRAATAPSGRGGYVRQIDVTGGRLAVSDPGTPPTTQLVADGLDGSLRQAGDGIHVTIEGRINESGKATFTGVYPTKDTGRPTTANLKLSGLELATISPWIEQVLARQVTAGILTLDTRYRGTDNMIEADNQVVIDGLELAESRADAPIPELNLALALLEDAHGRIEFSLPLRNPPAPADRVVRLAMTELVDGLVQAPLTALATAVGVAPNLGHIEFLAGNTAFTPDGENAVGNLALALQQRPRLGATVIPRFHPVADRHALARQQVMLHVALATSAGPPGSAARTALVLNDPKVISVLEEFANARLPAATLAALNARFEIHNDVYYFAMLQALIDNESVSGSALERIARFRARAIVDALTATGLNAERFVVTKAIQTAAQTEPVTAILQVSALPQRSANLSLPQAN